MKLSEKLKISVAFTLATILVVFMLVYEHKKTDLFNYTFRGNTFLTSDNASFEIEEQYKIFTIKDIIGDSAQVYSVDIALVPGVYNIDFQYALSGVSQAEYSVKSNTYLDDNNQTGRVFSEGVLKTEEGDVQLPIAVDQQISDLVLSVTVPSQAEFSIGRMTITSDTVKVYDYVVLAGFAVLAYAFLMFMLHTPKPLAKPAVINGETISGRRIGFALVFVMVAVAFFTSIPLLTEYLAEGYDLVYHLNRIDGIYNGLKAGQFPVRIHPQHVSGYGYANGIFYPELFMYFPALLRFAGMSLTGAYKIFVFAVNLATVCIAYISFSKFLKTRFMGLFAAILYTVSPYRLACIYERSAVGEYLAMAFLPLVMYGLYAVIFGDRKDWKYLFAGATGLLQSHILSTEIVVFFCAIIALIGITNIFGKEKRIIEIIKVAVSTICINLWFLLPFLKMSLQLDIAVFKRNPSLAENAIAQINEMFSILYLREFRGNTATTSPSGLGLVFLAVFVIFVAYAILKNRCEDEYKNHLLSTGKILCAFIVFTSVVSTSVFPWEAIQSVGIVSKIVGAIQFPNRTFTIAMLSFSVLSAIVVILLSSNGKERGYLAFVITMVALFSTNIYLDTANYFAYKPQSGNKFQYNLYVNDSWCMAMGEYVTSSTSLIDIFTRPNNIHTDEGVNIYNVQKNGTTINFEYEIKDYDAEKQYSAIMPLTMYPTYVAEINGTEYETYVAYGNYVQFDLVDAEGEVCVRYSPPKIFRLAEIISVVSLVLFLSWSKIWNIIKTPKNKV